MFKKVLKWFNDVFFQKKVTTNIPNKNVHIQSIWCGASLYEFLDDNKKVINDVAYGEIVLVDRDVLYAMARKALREKYCHLNDIEMQEKEVWNELPAIIEGILQLKYDDVKLKNPIINSVLESTESVSVSGIRNKVSGVETFFNKTRFLVPGDILSVNCGNLKWEVLP